ncbi:MAG: hypothetical protein WC142_06630 [Bacteroidales bacterium]|jgi:ABC-type enterochelin transport system permease subunit|nr:hypothetical protein [Bacteroidales bacterium]
MKNTHKILLIVLVILNIMVLLGQIIPQAAPPFANTVNIIFLIASLIYFISLLVKKK